MTRPRATTSPSDALGATIADLKARLARLENIAHQHNTPQSQLLPVASIIDWPDVTTIPDGFAAMGTTVTDAQNLYPILWARSPSAWKSGSNLVLPTLTGRIAIIRLL